MQLDEIFDKDGQDGIDNREAFSKFPKILQYFVRSQQIDLVNRIKRKVSEVYGADSLKDLIKTSGFRSIKTNERNNGVIDSLHLFGCAVDFAKVGIFKENPIPTCCNLECIDSGKCWHIQFKRENNLYLF